MHAMDKSRKALGFGVTTAMAAVLLAGCAGGPGPLAKVSAASANPQEAPDYNTDEIERAERAVAANPHDAQARLALGDAYLDGGRFASAETTFSDAMALGDASPRLALSLALTQIAQAKYGQAAALLNDWDREIARADLGLALALAGQPERGIHIMSNAIRGGENTVKMRQNLAYAFAMAGRWREARLMAEQDLDAGAVNARMEQWAGLSGAGAYQHRIAGLLQVPVGVDDVGQPVHLALNNSPDVPQLAVEATSGFDPDEELAALDTQPSVPNVAFVEEPVAPAVTSEKAMPALTETLQLSSTGPQAVVKAASGQESTDFVAAFAAPSQAEKTMQAAAPTNVRFVSNPVVQQVPSSATAAAPAPAAVRSNRSRGFAANAAVPIQAATPVSTSSHQASHLVQLGSFASEAGARRAWDIYTGRFPELADRDMVITEAVVRGKRYWRVSAGGFDTASSRAMCNRVRSGSRDGCITWAASSPLPGAVDTGVRLARR